MALATASLEGLDTFTLTEPAAEASIRVWVRGTEWTSGWHYDAAANAVVIDDFESVSAGSKILVQYGVIVDCD